MNTQNKNSMLKHWMDRFFKFCHKHSTVMLVVINIIIAAFTAILVIFAAFEPNTGNTDKKESVSRGQVGAGGEDGILVETHVFKLYKNHRDDGYHFYPTGHSTLKYGTAIISDISFWGGCDVFNHAWEMSPRVVLSENDKSNGEWYIRLLGGNCNNVSLSMTFFENSRLNVESTYFTMENPDKNKSRFKELRRTE